MYHQRPQYFSLALLTYIVLCSKRGCRYLNQRDNELMLDDPEASRDLIKVDTETLEFEVLQPNNAF